MLQLSTVLALTQLGIRQSDGWRAGIRSTNLHIVVECRINSDERAHFFTEVIRAYPAYESLSNIEKCDFALSNQDNQLMTWAGKFIYKSFARRSEILNGSK